MIKNKLAWQVVVVGNLSEASKQRFHALAKQLPGMSMHTPGFVSNIGHFMLACDVQAGRQEQMPDGIPFVGPTIFNQ